MRDLVRVIGRRWIGLETYLTLFQNPQLFGSFVHTLVCALITSVGKMVAGLAILLNGRIIARGYLRAVIFFPVLVPAVGLGITSKVLFDPVDGLINRARGVVGIDGHGWLTNPDLALASVRHGRHLEGRGGAD